MHNTSEIDELIKLISKLPGLGPKSAKRIVLKLINNRDELVKPLAKTLAEVYKNISRCKITEFQIELFPIDLTEEINLKMKTLDKKFIFRNKRLVLNFKNALSPDSVYQLLNSNL